MNRVQRALPLADQGQPSETVRTGRSGGAGTPVTVGVLCDIAEGRGGGVNEFSRGLVRSLSERSPEGFRFVVFVAEEDGEWARSGDRLAVVRVSSDHQPHGYGRWFDRSDRWGAAAWAALRADRDGALIQLRYRRRQKSLRRALDRSPWALDLMHFPYQDFVPSRIPSIFSPWDLQHRHLPELWGRMQKASRDAYYRAGCQAACCVALGSEWAREDVVRQYGIPRSKTIVVPVAPPTSLTDPVSGEFVARVREKYGLPRQFAFYPAATWEHKNHLQLIAALSRLSDRDVDLHLVCCGPCGRKREEILRHSRQLGVSDRVHLLGWVPAQEVRALYRLALLCVYPSLFEGAGLPVLEAFEEGCPLAASAATCIPEYAGNAAALFRPQDVDSIAGVLLSLVSSAELRRELVTRGRERARRYSWEAVTDEYLSLYQRIAAPRVPERQAKSRALARA